MVSDSELVDRLRDFLRTSDLNTTTTAIVRRKLEEDFGVDLSDKKAFIREQVDLFLQSQFEKPEEEEGDDEEEEEEKEEEEEEEEEEEASNGRGRKKGASNKLNKDVKKRGGGFTKLCSLSPQLQKFVGVPELARTEVVKQLWAYIRENNLQDPANKRNILCDEALRALFRVDTINMFQMNKALSKHIWPLESEDAPVKSTQKEKKRKQEREGPDESKPKEKRQKGGGSGFLAPLPLSDALVKFIGTGESALSRADVVKKMWEYIKQNNLQDPSDKRRIICDDKLKELFEVDSFNGFTVPKLLVAHFIKSEHAKPIIQCGCGRYWNGKVHLYFINVDVEDIGTRVRVLFNSRLLCSVLWIVLVGLIYFLLYIGGYIRISRLRVWLNNSTFCPLDSSCYSQHINFKEKHGFRVIVELDLTQEVVDYILHMILSSFKPKKPIYYSAVHHSTRLFLTL